ncbi:50S ribosomal protein L25 [Ferviditalea candida]|uniref:50S ribosomal protein L25 n=1 Tax=Ferviditalea candida TaxID=3108399 RepID=A0ABU5ZL66_9BACL|nr:50S ribosomal protein L25 [Paenibacillaceae bacterium T2]
MIREIQRDALNREILHVDFREINLNQPIKTTVRIDYSGHSPGVEHGGILQVQMHEIEVEALPQRIPSAIEADMSSLDLGGHLLAGDLSAPEGVKIVTNPEEVIATILTPREEETLEPEAEAADEGEPGLAEKDEAKPLQTE